MSVQLIDEEAAMHATYKWKPALSEVAQTHLAFFPDLAFFGGKAYVRLPAWHPLAKNNKSIGRNASTVVRVTGLDGRTTAGVRIQIAVITPDGTTKVCFTVFAYDSLLFL